MCIRDSFNKGLYLLKEDNFSVKKISEKIRNEELSIEDQPLLDFLYDLTIEKIKIDNPKYLKE